MKLFRLLALIGPISLTSQAFAAGGVPLWTNYYSGPGDGFDFARAIAVCSNGHVIVAGDSLGPGGDSYDYAITACSSSGVPLWTNRYEGMGGDERVTAVAVGTEDRIYVTGYSWGGITNGHDYATVAYSSNGVPLWTNRFTGPDFASDFAEAMTVARDGSVYVTGEAGSAVNFATLKLSSSLPVLVHLAIQPMNDRVKLSWTNTDLGLESSARPAGTYTNVPGAFSPYYTPITGPERYFRLNKK